MKYSRVICLVRGDETDAEVIETAVNLLESNRRRIRFVYVIVVDRRLPLDEPDQEDYRLGESALRAAEQVSGTRGQSRGVIMQARSIAPVLIREALDYGAEIIVAGAKVYESIGEKTIDADSEYLLANAPCAVVLHREHAPGYEIELDRASDRGADRVAHVV